MSKGKVFALIGVGLLLFLGLAVALSRQPTPPTSTSPPVVAQVEPSTTALLGQPLNYDGAQIMASPLKEGEAFGSSPRVCTTVEYSNTGEDVLRLSQFEWKLQTPQGTQINPSLTGSDDQLPYGDIIPGGNARGDICFEYEVGPTGFVVIYDPFGSDPLSWTQG